MRGRTELPEGLTVINSDADLYRYTEPGDPVDDLNFVDFTVCRDGIVEVTSAGSPFVPVEVLTWIARLAEARRR